MVIEMGKDLEISLYRERRATKEERKKDPEATVMAEWVHITFGDGKPQVVVDRDLCGN